MVVSRSSLAQEAVSCSATFPTPVTSCNALITVISIGGAKVGKLAALFGM
jgi:energy-converting hydrogenase Eha subunit A